MKVCVLHREDITWSIGDVTEGLRYGLRMRGVDVTAEPKGADWIIVVNPMFQTHAQLTALRQHAPVAALCTETPYDIDRELECVALCDAGWTHERVSVPEFQAVNPHFGYLPHAWHPERHYTGGHPIAAVPSHDVVFVGSGFPERVRWLNRIDWTGIDLGLYGLWEGLGLDDRVEQCVRQELTSNVFAGMLYRNAKIGLNLYRTKPGIRAMVPRADVVAESLNPRAYELAACGVFHLSSPRAEVGEMFGDLVPTVPMDDPKAGEAAIRDWLARDADRKAVAAQLPATVKGQSWLERAGQVVADLYRWSTVTA